MTGFKNIMTFNYFSAIFSLVIISVFIRQRFPSGVGNMHYIWNGMVVLHLNRNLPAQENEHMTDVCCSLFVFFLHFMQSLCSYFHYFFFYPYKTSPWNVALLFPQNQTKHCVWKQKQNKTKNRLVLHKKWIVVQIRILYNKEISARENRNQILMKCPSAKHVFFYPLQKLNT